MTHTKPRRLIARLPFLAILVVAAIGAFALRDQLSFEALSENRENLVAFRDRNYLLCVLGFLAAYMAIVALSLPGATIASLTGGFLFGIFPGMFYSIAAAGTGAVIIFLAAKAGFGAEFAERIKVRGGAPARLQAALQDNEWSALMIMRLAPIVPFFLANLIPAFVGVRTSRFVITTFVGIIPGALVLTSVGAGLDQVFATGGMPDLSVIFEPHILIPILGLVALSALPILVKWFGKAGGK